MVSDRTKVLIITQGFQHCVFISCCYHQSKWSIFKSYVLALLLLLSKLYNISKESHLFLRCWFDPMHLKVPFTMIAMRPHSASHSSMLKQQTQHTLKDLAWSTEWWQNLDAAAKRSANWQELAFFSSEQEKVVKLTCERWGWQSGHLWLCC